MDFERINTSVEVVPYSDASFYEGIFSDCGDVQLKPDKSFRVSILVGKDAPVGFLCIESKIDGTYYRPLPFGKVEEIEEIINTLKALDTDPAYLKNKGPRSGLEAIAELEWLFRCRLDDKYQPYS